MVVNVRYKKHNNPNEFLEIIYADVQSIKTDLTIIKEKLKQHEKLIYFILSIITAVFVKVVFLS